MKWIPANQPPPKKYHSDAMTYIPLLLAFDDEKELRERKHAVMGMFIGGLLMEWRIDGSPSSFHPTHWMPCPLTPKHMPKRVRYTGPKLPCSTCNGHGSYQEGGTLSPHLTCETCRGKGWVKPKTKRPVEAQTKGHDPCLGYDKKSG